MKLAPGSPSLRPSHLPLGTCPEEPWQAVRATLQEPCALISPWVSQPGAQALTPHCLANSLFCVFLRETESEHSRSRVEVALSMCLCCAHRQAVAPVCVCARMLHVHVCMHEPGLECGFRNQASLDVASHVACEVLRQPRGEKPPGSSPGWFLLGFPLRRQGWSLVTCVSGHRGAGPKDPVALAAISGRVCEETSENGPLAGT